VALPAVRVKAQKLATATVKIPTQRKQEERPQ